MAEHLEETLVAQYVAAGISPVTAQQIAEETAQHQADAEMAAPFARRIAEQLQKDVTSTIQELGLEA